MASAIFNPPYISNPPSPKNLKKSQIFASSSISHISCLKNPSIHLGLSPFSHWSGLKKHGFSISLQSLKLEKRKKCKGKNGVFASLFGVGAPEALVIGVVALLVFGPKGLAEVAKNLGKTLREFQPTIRELQEVSREFKSTLEKEIGLDELNNPVQGNYTSNTVRPSSTQVPPDTQQNSQLTVIPPAATTEDSQVTSTTPTGSPEDPQETATSSAVTPEDNQEIATTSAVTSEDTQETTATSAVTVEDSQTTVDTSNGSPDTKFYTSEDLLKITEEQLKALASQQQEEQSSSPTTSEKPNSDI
uniref:sec-independent protein translocase protein TATB, chloroplastic-like n=1 Tax=Erigeron canadensis TaxID=72917 RepID=UPI001CB97222|nr:sec-independent protein translocase protein TATB, chloroplastic-like [Erigeron canadensis]